MTQAERIINKFGGLSALSRALGHKHPTTVQGWKARGFVPPRHHEDILEAGRGLATPIVPADFLTVRPDGAEQQPAEAAE